MKPSLKKALKTTHNPAWYGGAKCSSCRLDRIEEINRDIRDFFKAKRAGHPMPWAAFVREYLTPEYKIRIKAATLITHVNRCLKLEG